MAFVVARPNGSFEVRESRSTSAGPRARTLATFRELDESVVEKVRERAESPPPPEDLRRKALKVGAPVGEKVADMAARDLLREVARGRPPSPKLRLLLFDALEDPDRSDRPERDVQSKVSSSARAVEEWAGATATDRAATLEDLLKLVDALPTRSRPPTISFPRLATA